MAVRKKMKGDAAAPRHAADAREGAPEPLGFGGWLRSLLGREALQNYERFVIHLFLLLTLLLTLYELLLSHVRHLSA